MIIVYPSFPGEIISHFPSGALGPISRKEWVLCQIFVWAVLASIQQNLRDSAPLRSLMLCLFAQGGDVSSKRLMEMVTSAHLSPSEIQALIDVLLNKQGDNSQWKKV